MTLLLCVCILRDLPQEKNPRALCEGEILLCSPGGRKTSSHLFTYVEVPILVGSPEVQEHLQVGLSQENPLVREPPLQQNSLQKLFVS